MFGALLRLCGLNAGDAAIFLGVPRPEILAWIASEERPPAHALREIYALFDRQEEAVEEILKFWREAGEPDHIELRVPTTNQAAQADGWPCVGAQLAPIAIAQATLTNVEIHLAPQE